MPPFVRAVALAVAALAVVGCASRHPVDPDKLADGEYRTDWVVDGIYRAAVPMFLIKRSAGYDVRHELVPERDGGAGAWAPSTIDTYTRDGPKRWPAVRAVLPAGTRLQFKGVAVGGGWPSGRYAVALGLILERQHTNLGLVDFDRLCRPEPFGLDLPAALRDARLTEPLSLASPFHTPSEAAAAAQGTDPTDPNRPHPPPPPPATATTRPLPLH